MTSFLEATRSGLEEALRENPRALLLGQLVRYGLGGLTTGLEAAFPRQVITFPVCENLMNASAMGLSLAGYVPIVVHERMDFVAVGMDPLVNHIPVWPARAPMDLPLVVMAIVGKGKGQGPQHSKDLSPWFRRLEGWTVVEPASPDASRLAVLEAVRGKKPVFFVAHREFFAATGPFVPPARDYVGLCGASKRHEREYYAL